MQAFTVLTGRGVPLRRSDVDTDQIFPGRFGTRTTATGYEDTLFADWRAEPGFVLNDPRYRGATILVAGSDFGTGSSREFAVWALQDYGFRVVVSPRFGDIFRGNALKRGLLAVRLDAPVVERLWQLTEEDPATEITVDLERRTVTAPGIDVPFEIDDHTRARLLEGLDDIAATERHADAIAAYESRRRPALPTTGAVRHG
ncbi:3-isopropylmalate dehydratase small subunit [Streptomyces sp. DH41]|uniref:3-isopropylmalate dehydratase small subunit n=1 Tax=Streptomyces sp. DH41 TaxID=3040125 RepID=UPI002441D1B5|nr:3-isopropylmalate dehydratase small subunit [Streptomyces sp. DH41]MDG9722873.1 3-isopropylmalate dehydratase small subunit [Streptomyces sp. DH41]